MIKENYLRTLYKEHRKKPFTIYRLAMCGGSIRIEQRLIRCMEEGVAFISNIFTDKRIMKRHVILHPNGKEMLLNLCNTINALDRADVSEMSRGYCGKRFYETNTNQDNFLKFIIMYVWDNLDILDNPDYKNREERVNYFKSIITNELVLDAIEFMNERYKRSPLHKDTIESYNKL